MSTPTLVKQHSHPIPSRNGTVSQKEVRQTNDGNESRVSPQGREGQHRVRASADAKAFGFAVRPTCTDSSIQRAFQGGRLSRLSWSEIDVGSFRRCMLSGSMAVKAETKREPPTSTVNSLQIHGKEESSVQTGHYRELRV